MSNDIYEVIAALEKQLEHLRKVLDVTNDLAEYICEIGEDQPSESIIDHVNEMWPGSYPFVKKTTTGDLLTMRIDQERVPFVLHYRYLRCDVFKSNNGATTRAAISAYKELIADIDGLTTLMRAVTDFNRANRKMQEERNKLPQPIRESVMGIINAR